MEITLNSDVSNKTIRKKIKKLYLTAFPAEERAPFFLIMSKARNENGEMLAAYDGEKFIGFVYMVCYKDLAYLFYLAVEGGERGKGYGGKILSAVKEKYSGKRIFLAREQLDKNAENYSQRVSRRNFYLHNGFTDLPCLIKEASVVYDVMSIGGSVSAEEYDALITAWIGKFLRKIVDMRIIEK